MSLKKTTTKEANKIWKTVENAAKNSPEWMKQDIKLAAQKEKLRLSDNILSAELVGKTIEDPELGIGIIRKVEDGYAEVEFIEAEGKRKVLIKISDLINE